MPIYLYTVCWNEEEIIPFFLRHYEPLVDRIIVYDDDSTDGSRELLRASPKVEVRSLERGAESFLSAQVTLCDFCWQESRGEADWICLVDMDEFLVYPDWHNYLAEQKKAGITIIPAVGYDTVSENFPARGADLAATVTRGERNVHLDKATILDPDAIEQINFTVGRHCSAPVGRVVWARPRHYVQLRHYKSLGLEYVLRRTKALASRVSEEDRALGWAAHYFRDEDTIRADFQRQLAQAEPIPAPSPVATPRKEAQRKRWWQRRS